MQSAAGGPWKQLNPEAQGSRHYRFKAGSDGLTLNADCANKRVGIGTTAPVKQVELGGANAYIGSTAGGANMSGQNLSVVAGIGQGVGQTAGHLYLGS